MAAPCRESGETVQLSLISLNYVAKYFRLETSAEAAVTVFELLAGATGAFVVT
ncbi:hypothetical protein PhaeoP14_03265 [Phaeobacter piscinae]|nr:hypothetical protein PhaeoP14_03265 [Phaeobacter piscinae]